MRDIFKIQIDGSRIYGLDILRAFAILFVVIGHGVYLLPSRFKSINNLFVLDGVSIFFVLSGFLIGGILIKIIDQKGFNRQILFDFWIRRWFRTLPNYFLVLILLTVLSILFVPDFDFSSVKSYFLFSQNLVTPHPHFFPEAWSLCVEEWFYLSVPLVIGAFYYSNLGAKKSLLFSAIIIIFLVTVLRYTKYLSTPVETINEWDQLFRKMTSTRLDSLMFGVIGAYISYYHFDLWIKRKNMLLLLGITLILLAKFVFPKVSHVGGLYSTVFSFSLVSISTLLVLPFLSQLKSGKGLIYSMLTRISLISYSMYLLNLSVIQYWIIYKIQWNSISDNGIVLLLMKYGLYWVLVISLSTLLYKYFEVPVTKLRDNRLFSKVSLS